ncbi:hypothetical protein CEV33_4179 [Brucella grignonensis]|uniref:Uncharacterized protein n=1 Tax=Brucella grignonensis TaxID=94627 RepID=A0A256FQD5_9HYPH|nr:hypothetical protein CEV33_4179 [Brucella grignonensis]
MTLVLALHCRLAHSSASHAPRASRGFAVAGRALGLHIQMKKGG